MNTTTANSLASAALTGVVAALAWLIAHSAQIRKLLELLPAAAAVAAKAQAAVEGGGLGQAVTHVKVELSAEARAELAKVAAELAAQMSATPAATTTGTPDPTASTAPDGLAEGGTYTVRDGKLLPTGA